MQRFIRNYKIVLLYGVSLAALLFVMRWLEFRVMMINHSTEIYMAVLALVFTGLGIWLALNLAKPKTVVVEKTVYAEIAADFVRDEHAVAAFGLSKREIEVLELMASGLSNGEIAERLFVSLNTIKTHTSKVFEKMEVSRRTQAVELAKRKGIIPL